MKNIKKLEKQCESNEERKALSEWVLMMLELRKHINIRESYEGESDEVQRQEFRKSKKHYQINQKETNQTQG